MQNVMDDGKDVKVAKDKGPVHYTAWILDYEWMGPTIWKKMVLSNQFTYSVTYPLDNKEFCGRSTTRVKCDM